MPSTPTPPNAQRRQKTPSTEPARHNQPGRHKGGLSAGELFVEESYVTERGRKRKRVVRLDIDAVLRQLTPPSSAEREIWLNARALMLSTVGESMFHIWLAPVELLATNAERRLVLTGPEATLSWVQKRFGRPIAHSCEENGRGVRFASPQERAAIDRRPEAAPSAVAREPATMNRRVS